MATTVGAPITPIVPVSKEGHKEAIKQIESALACIPGEENAPLREVMSAKIVVHRQALAQSKPVGQRLDGCKAALGRAQGRLAAAEEAAKLAEEARIVAVEEVRKLQAEHAVLQAQVAEQGGDAEDEPSTPLVSLQQQLRSSVLMLKEIEGMDPEVIQDAEVECASIMSKFEATVAMMEKRVAETHAAVKRKHSTKSAPVVGSDTPILEEDRRRSNGKQAKPAPKPKRQTPITNFFGNAVPGPMPPLGGEQVEVQSYGPAPTRRVPKATIANSPSL